MNIPQSLLTYPVCLANLAAVFWPSRQPCQPLSRKLKPPKQSIGWCSKWNENAAQKIRCLLRNRRKIVRLRAFAMCNQRFALCFVVLRWDYRPRCLPSRRWRGPVLLARSPWLRIPYRLTTKLPTGVPTCTIAPCVSVPTALWIYLSGEARTRESSLTLTIWCNLGFLTWADIWKTAMWFWRSRAKKLLDLLIEMWLRGWIIAAKVGILSESVWPEGVSVNLFVFLLLIVWRVFYL